MYDLNVITKNVSKWLEISQLPRLKSAQGTSHITNAFKPLRHPN